MGYAHLWEVSPIVGVSSMLMGGFPHMGCVHSKEVFL